MLTEKLKISENVYYAKKTVKKLSNEESNAV